MATQTIGSGGDQPDWATWEATLGSLSASETGAQLDQALTITSQIGFDGITLNGHTLTMTANTGDGFPDIMDPTTGAVTFDNTKGASIAASAFMAGMVDTTVDMTISRLQFTFSNGVYDKEILRIRAVCTLDQLIVHAAASTTGGSAFMVQATQAGASTFQRSLFIGQGNYSGVNSSGASIYNCGFINTAGGSGKTGIVQYGGNPVVKNCFFLGFSAASSGTANAASANNACTNASFAGTNFNGGTPLVSVVAADALEGATGAADARLKTGSVLIGAGTASGVPTEDMFGQTWNSGTPDIGPVRAAAGGGGGAHAKLAGGGILTGLLVNGGLAS